MYLRKLLLSLLLLFSINASATTPVWSDLWWNPNESGWGVNLVQQQGAMFMTYFIYDQNNNAVWVVAVLTPGAVQSNGLNVWNGTVYASEGPYFGGPFDPMQVTQVTAGSVTFAPISETQATLTYSVFGVNVAKAIQRETFTHITLSGSYQGGYSVESSTCSSVPAGSFGILQLIISASLPNSDGVTGTIATTLNFDSTGSCGLSGNYLQAGSLYNVSNSGSCATPLSFASVFANFTTIAPTSQGIEGEINLTGSGCSALLQYGSVRVN